jgi:hypothetical protein
MNIHESCPVSIESIDKADENLPFFMVCKIANQSFQLQYECALKWRA